MNWIEQLEKWIVAHPGITGLAKVLIPTLFGAGLLGVALKWSLEPIKKGLTKIVELIQRVTRPRPKIRIVQNLLDSQQSLWATGTMGKDRKINIRGRYHLTLEGSWNYHPSFIKAIFKPTKEVGQVFFQIHYELHGHISHPGDSVQLNSETTYNMTVDFLLKPSIEKEGQPIKAEILLVDQYGKEHSIGEQTFNNVSKL